MDNDLNKPEKEQEERKKRENKHLVKMMVIELGTEFAFMIALPIISLVLLGKWLDNRYHTKLFIILGFFLALIISSVAIGKRINQIRKRMK